MQWKYPHPVWECEENTLWISGVINSAYIRGRLLMLLLLLLLAAQHDADEKNNVSERLLGPLAAQLQ